MKTLELHLNKRLLIVEYETEAEITIDLALMKAFNNPKVIKFGLALKPICKGSELTEDIAKGLVDSRQSNFFDREYYWDYRKKRFSISKNVLESFISAIESKNHHWGENPVKKPIKYNYGYHDNINVLDTPPEWDEDCYYEDLDKWQEAKSQTFNPTKCIIFEILKP